MNWRRPHPQPLPHSQTDTRTVNLRNVRTRRTARPASPHRARALLADAGRRTEHRNSACHFVFGPRRVARRAAPTERMGASARLGRVGWRQGHSATNFFFGDKKKKRRRRQAPALQFEVAIVGVPPAPAKPRGVHGPPSGERAGGGRASSCHRRHARCR